MNSKVNHFKLLVWNLFNQRYTCNQCGRSYKHKSNLCNHKREECGKPPSYFCPVCEKGFKKKQHLQRHLTVHSDIDLSGHNIDKDLLKSLLPQNLSNSQEFKSPLNPCTTIAYPKSERSLNTACRLPPVSIFPCQINPYSSCMYPNQIIRPILMHSTNFPCIPTSLSSTHDSSQDNLYPSSQPNQQYKDGMAVSEA